MKANKIFILFLFICPLVISAQIDMTVDHERAYLSQYYEFGKRIDSLSQLPKHIQENTDLYLKEVLGELKPNVRFFDGQVIDLDAYFKKRPHWAINGISPNYELVFLLSDTSIGIKAYYIKLEMDQYGQILKSNWPGYGHDKRSYFLDTDSIRTYVLNYAKNKGYLYFDTLFDGAIRPLNYSVWMTYDPIDYCLVWTFSFPEPNTDGGHWFYFNMVTARWNSLYICGDERQGFTPYY